MPNYMIEEYIARSHSLYNVARKQYKKALELWIKDEITLTLLCYKKMEYYRAKRRLEECTKS